MDRLRVALATCADLPRLAPADRQLPAALAARGIAAEPVVWNDPAIEWEDYDAVLLRSTWDYHRDRDAFLAWAETTAARASLWNPPALVGWSTEKAYLRELAEAGVATIPTAWPHRGEAARLEAIRAARGWAEVVVKPTVALGADRLLRVGVATAEAGPGQAHLEALLAGGDAMVQPFLDSVVSRGETSLVFFDGELSHALRKRPKRGDFRVQPRWGGSVVAVAPEDAELRLARTALACLGDAPLYARVDLVAGSDGEPLLIELELVEPNLYLDAAPGAAERFATAIAARLTT